MSVVFFLIIFVISLLNAQTVQCPQGSFAMGSEKGEDDEVPVHTIRLSAFTINSYEITEAQYDSCVSCGKCTPAHYDDGKCYQWTGTRFLLVKVPRQNRNPSFPVVCVTWQQAAAYCRSKGMSLPSETQWEYASTAGSGTTYSWGEESPSSGNCTMAGADHPSPAGTFSPNKWGLYDMTGNVWEWTSDFYSRDAYSFEQSSGPAGPDAGLYRVIRGGGWYSDKKQLRTANRHWFTPNAAEVSIGFRCVRK
ncbi:MAG: SUMF1/EgtB/PvdO family nonheme iron enzyme [Chitinispirillaceae bacterium]|nr:SUMF1/EgtB/PvdO family nonheme iron enzyme [Chitinispirillaceae bacterium]